MEIIGRNIPQLQSAISSGLDNVTSGIAESVKASGISALEDTFQVFSTSNMGTATDTYLLPAVANVAEYSDPITALTKQSAGSSEAASSLPLLQTMQNPKFAPEAELATFTEAKVNETFKDLAKVVVEPPDKLGDIYPPPIVFSERELPYASAANDNLRIMPYKAESESAQGRSILKNEYAQAMLDSANKKQKEIEDKMKKMEEAQWRKLKESLGQVDQLPYVTTDVGTAATKDAQSSVVSQIADTPTTGSGTASASASLEARGIIIVGGKTDGTYFQTIDDSMNDLRNDPQPETVELLRNQVTAVQDMTSTSMKAVQLYQQYFSSRVIR